MLLQLHSLQNAARAHTLSAAPLMHELFCRRGQGRRSDLREAGSGKM